MVTTVNRNPIAVCAVRAVPTNRVSVVSLSAVEKTPESAMTAAPHTKRKTTRTAVGAAKNSGDATQQVPLITSAATAAGGRPKPVRCPPAQKAPDRPGDADSDERDESGRRRGRVASLCPAGDDEHRQPGPQGVELPHVPEVAEAHQPRSALDEYRDRVARIRCDRADVQVRAWPDQT